jgi:hypothetical protein
MTHPYAAAGAACIEDYGRGACLYAIPQGMDEDVKGLVSYEL